MKSLARLAFLCLAPTLAGCIQLEQTLSVAKEGSGRLDCNYSISEQTLTQLRGLAKLHEQLGKLTEQDPGAARDVYYMDLFLFRSDTEIKQEFEKYRRLGVTVDAIKVDSRNGRRYLNMRILFKDIGKLAQVDLFQDYGFELTRDKDNNYVLTRPAPGGDAGSRGLDPASEKILAPLLAGMQIRVQFNAPSKIVKSNATMTAVYLAEWMYDYDNDPNSFLRLQNQPMTATFESARVTLPEIRLAPRAPQAPAPAL